MIPTIEQVEEALEHIENLLFSSLNAATSELPNINEAINRLWVDISRYGPEIPSFPEVRLPVGDYRVPPPPPPPPPSVFERIVAHKTTIAATVGVGVLAAGCGALYITSQSRSRRHQARKPSERRKVIVLLGGDSPLALPLINELQKSFIVVVSVATPERAEALEQACGPYTRALVLDPSEPSTIPAFLRSLSSTLTRRFPLGSGDPHASLNHQPYVYSLISLLSLPGAAAVNPAGPLEHISLQSSYIPYLNATHITLFTIIQAVLPLFRLSRGAERSKSIIVCLPAAAARIGVPFAGVQAMSAAATIRGLDVLRRELAVAAATGRDYAEGLKNVQVYTVDVGTFDSLAPAEPHDVLRSMDNWTASEKLTYGPSFVALGTSTQHTVSRSYWSAFSSMFSGGNQYGIPRKPTDTAVFVKQIIHLVNRDSRSLSFLGVGLSFRFYRIINAFRNSRFSVGSGAMTYAFASHLPSIILNALLNLPYFLIGIRDSLLPLRPFVLPESTLPAPSNQMIKSTPSVDGDSLSDPDSGYEADGADAESNAGSASGAGEEVDSSWIMPHSE